MRDLRDYQSVACTGVETHWQAGERAVCLVSPVGSGKSTMGSSLVARHPGRRLWIAHRRELVDQAADTLREFNLDVGILSASRTENTDASVLCVMWQTLVARPDLRPHADLAVIDEAHHSQGEDWSVVLRDYSSANLLGLTATPQRGDGRPLNAFFQRLVVAAQYSELIRAGYIVPCRLYRPSESLGSDLAKDPAQAYLERAAGKQCIAFCRSVEDAEKLALQLSAAGHPAMALSGKTADAMRGHMIDAFKSRDLRVLCSVQTITEGFDVPDCEAVLLARGFSHTGTFIQAVGRGLRSSPGKTECIVIDLPGASWVHGIPTEDRTYTLDGRAISSSGALRVCSACGWTYEPNGEPGCPVCGFKPPATQMSRPRIYDLELIEVWQGEATPEPAKEREWNRLVELCRDKGFDSRFAVSEYKKLFNSPPPGATVRAEQWARIRAVQREKKHSISWACKQYRLMFGEAPLMGDVTHDEKRAELSRLEALAMTKGFKRGWSAVNYKNIFGHWPSRV